MAAVAELATFATATGTPWAAAAAEHGRALLADDRDAEAHFTAALAHHARSPRRVDRTRTELAFGEHLRRARRRVDARAHLRAALEIFDDVGAGPWAERARQELRASGETARRRDDSPATALTPQELQVARLSRRGCPTGRSRPGCSSARGRSSFTCATSSPRPASRHARSSPGFACRDPGGSTGATRWPPRRLLNRSERPDKRDLP